MKRSLAVIAAMILLFALTGAAAAEQEASGSLVDPSVLTLYSINVGKGDSHLLFYGEYTYLIDTAKSWAFGRVSAALKELGVTHLNGIIVTHTDKDHAGGVPGLAVSDVQVDAWYASPYYNVKKKNHPVLNAAALRGQQAILLQPGDALPFGDGRLTVLGPLEADDDTENNNSLVLRAEAADGSSILLTGDMEFAEEETLLNAGALQPADVLKMPDHAEDHSTSEALLAAVRPKLGIISTNSVEEPDTPSPRILKLMKQYGVETCLTQDAEAGVLIEVREGNPTVTLLKHAAWPAAAEGVTLSDKSVAQDMITLRNDGPEAVDISGWYLYSETGDELFVFPDGALLEPRRSVTVSSLSSPDGADYVWQDKQVWNPKKNDTAYLYDACGRLIDSLE